MDKPFSRFMGQILPNMPDIVQAIKSTIPNYAYRQLQKLKVSDVFSTFVSAF